VKRLSLVVLVLALVGVGIAVWWWYRSRPASTTAPTRVTGFVEADYLSIASPLTPPPWDAASPLELEVTLLRPPAPESEWTEERPWWNQLGLYRVDGEVEAPVDFEIIEPLEGPAADDEVQFATLAIAAGRLPAGPVTLRPRLRYPDGSTLAGGELRGRVAPGVRTPRARTIAEARVHLGAGRYDAALRALDGVEFAEMADVQILRADALAGAGRVEEAIALLRTLLAEFSEESEPPTAIWQRIRQLEQGREQ
jgi:hypothetical protein